MDVNWKPAGWRSPLVVSVTVGFIAALTCLGMIELGTGSAPSIGLGIVGFSSVIAITGISAGAKVRERVSQNADATDAASRRR